MYVFKRGLLLLPVFILICFSAHSATIASKFTITPKTQQCQDSTFTFTDNSTASPGNIATRKWYFGDGGTSTGTTAPTHTYASSGTFTVSLAVTSSDGLKDSSTQKVTVNALPVVSYKITKGQLCQLYEIVFKSTSTVGSGSISSISWDFGDGSSVQTGDSVLKVYSKAGTFTLKMIVTTSFGCTSTLSKSLIINPKPTAGFTYTPRCQDSVVTFDGRISDTSKIVVGGWAWIFHDGTKQFGNTATYKYSTPGSYTVRMAVINKSGCNDTATKTITVYDNPQINITIPDVCFDSVLSIYDKSTATYGPVWNYSWDFGHPATGADNVLTYTGRKDTVIHFDFPKAGTYTVSLTLKTIKGCASKYSKAVTLNPLPVLDYTFRKTCEDSAVAFVDKSASTVGFVKYEWRFGDKTPTVTGKSVTHVFTNPGTYKVRYVVTTNKGCKDSIEKSVVIYPKPVSKFSFVSNCQDSVVTFSDKSTFPVSSGVNDTIVSWYWNFGDGSAPEYTKDASHIYTKAGSYLVKHAVFNKYGCSDTSSSNAVQAFTPPTSKFGYKGRCQYDSIQFLDSSTAPNAATISTWFWNFGDGSFSTSQNPKHAFVDTGVINVSLKVVSSDGCGNTLKKSIFIYSAPVPKFSSTPTCIGTPATFADQSTANTAVISKSYDWDFGDTTTIDHSKSPVHSYKNFGSFKVKEIVYADYGKGVVCQNFTTKDITVSPLPKADFYYTASNCLDSTFTFIDNSTISKGALKAWVWDFGDNTTATGSSQKHQYSVYGTYTVKMKVYSNTGCADSILKDVHVWPLATPSFTFTSRCADSALDFSASAPLATGDVVDYSWDFQDLSNPDRNKITTHKFPKSGTYNVKMSVTTDRGCITSISKQVDVKRLPKVDFSATARCAKDNYNFVDQTPSVSGVNPVFWKWNFGDGSVDSSGKNVTHVFADSGTYFVKLIVRNNLGCVDSIIKPAVVFGIPAVNFGVRGSCTGEVFVFRDSTVITGGIDNYAWSFGDGGASSSAIAQHSYTDSGLYKVTLSITATNGGCTGVGSKYVRVYPLPVPKMIVNTVCLNQPSIFIDSSKAALSNIQSWELKFGDGTAQTYSSNSNIFHIYSSPGKFKSFLRVTTDHGCIDTTNIPVKVLAKPTAYFKTDPDTITIINPIVKFDNLSTGGVVASIWDFGDGFESKDPSPIHTYLDTGIYPVMLVVLNSNGCYDTMLYSLQVYDKYTMFAPNVVSANGDGINDVWRANGRGFLNFSVVIVDRWGQVVFKSDDITQPWKMDYNGNGVPVPEGVYKYYIRANNYDNTEFKKLTGNITVYK